MIMILIIILLILLMCGNININDIINESNEILMILLMKK